jgi:D-lyxose ketol-isomerase
MKRSEWTHARDRVVRYLEQAGIALSDADRESVEIAELGLGRLELEGLGLITYINTDRYCAKELVLLPRQTCPEHKHPDVNGQPGKMETFRCRSGKVFLYVEGAPAEHIHAVVPAGSEAYYTVRHEIELRPGEQFTIPPNTLHWFQAGDEGAVVSEFSSTSRDEFDIFTDPRIVRIPSIEED